MKQVLIVEDQRMPRENMERVISESNNYEFAASVNGADVALAICRRQRIDLVLMDVCTAGNKDGIEAAAEIKAEFPNIKIIIVTSMVEVGYLQRAREAKVDSFWYKDSPSGDLVNVIDGTLSGKRFWPDSAPSVRLGNTLSCELSDREIETLRLLCEGKTNAEIAVKLNVAESSVRTYISRMLEKTGYTNRNRLMIAAVSKRMVVPGCWLEEEES